MDDPDPVPELTKQLTNALRLELGQQQDHLAAAFGIGQEESAASEVWSRLSDEHCGTLATTCQLTPPARAAIGTDEEIRAALIARTLTDRRNLLDAAPQRFARALA